MVTVKLFLAVTPYTYMHNAWYIKPFQSIVVIELLHSSLYLYITTGCYTTM